MDSFQPKFGSDVKTGNATHTHQKTHDAFWREEGSAKQASKEVREWLKRAWKGKWHWLSLCIEGEAGLTRPWVACSSRWYQRNGAPALSHQLPQMRGRKGKGSGELKSYHQPNTEIGVRLFIICTVVHPCPKFTIICSMRRSDQKLHCRTKFLLTLWQMPVSL